MTTHPEQDYYQLLGVARTASAEEIKGAYRALAQRYHPDVNPSTRTVAEAKFKEITAAYSVLSDPSQRSEYDSSLDIAGESAPTAHAPHSRYYGAGRGANVSVDVRVGGTSVRLGSADLRRGLIRALRELAHLMEKSVPG